MSTLYFTNSQIRIYRFRQVGSSQRWSISATFTAYEATIEPATPQRTEMASGQIGHVFTGFVSIDADVKEGDQLRIIGDDKIYNVKGVSRWEGAGLLDHLELTLIAEDDNG